MSNESQPASQPQTWNPAEVSPWGWIFVGIVVSVIGAFVATAHSSAVEVLGLLVAGIGGLLSMIGVIAAGVEIALRRTR